MGKKIALITGIDGMVGSYLARELVAHGYKVVGLRRHRGEHRIDPRKTEMLRNAEVTFETGDLLDPDSIRQIIDRTQPTHVFNLAAQSFVKASWDVPASTLDINAKGVVHILEAIRSTGAKIKFFNAATSEMFGMVQEIPQTEKTPFYPRSPYGVAKLAAYWMTVNYRESYGMHAASAICFNMEGPLRGPNFVTRKITLEGARIKTGLSKGLVLGNTEAKRDWTHVSDSVRGMRLMMELDKPDDFIFASGETHSVQEFLEDVFEVYDLDPEKYVSRDPKYMRPAEVNLLLGDATKAKTILGWEPRVTFKELVHDMCKSDLAYVSKYEINA
jgi:GDPmannose 4,6-dehydratase